MAKKSNSFRLLKSHILNPEESLKENHRLEAKPLSSDPWNKRLFAGQAYSSPPGWIAFFDPQDRPHFDDLHGGQAAAVLFVSVSLPDADERADAEPQTRWLRFVLDWDFKHFGPKHWKVNSD